MRLLLLTTTCAAALGIVSQTAAAQEAGANAAPQTNAEGADQTGLTDIIVTAQRRQESLQRAAIAVSAVSGDVLKAAGVTRPTELTSLVPSLQVAPSAGPYNLFYLRGVGNFQGNGLSESAVAFNVDGVYIGRPSGTTGYFYDLERIEVVKGPQGTLYGRNATGGAINVITKKPDLGSFGANASVEFGNYDAVRLDGAINLPLGENAAVRFAGIRVRHDGYMNDGTDDQDDWGLRGSLRFEPSDSLRIDLVADYFDQGGLGVGSTPLLAPGGVPTAATFNIDDRIGFLSPQGQAFYTSQPAVTLARNFNAIPAQLPPFQNNYTWGISSTINWENSFGTLTIVPAYRETGLDYRSYSAGFHIGERSKTEQKSIEARFATSDDNPLRALIGAFYFDESSRGPVTSYVSEWNGQYDSNTNTDTESVALFGRLTYAVTPDFRITGGVRHTWEDKSFTGQRLSFTRICLSGSAVVCANSPGLPLGTTPPPERASSPIDFGLAGPTLFQVVLPANANFAASFNKATWRAGADWDITPQNLVYASYETGFKAGGFFYSPGAGTYQPESIGAYTLGSKNRFMDNRLQVNLELFYWKYRDQQISHLVTISGVPTFATENVGRATFKGLELETRFAATDTTTLNFNLQYLDAKYNQFVYKQTNQSGLPIPGLFNGSGCPTTGFDPATNNSFIVDCSGRRPANAPKWSINAGVQQRIPVSFGEFVFDARSHYQSQTLIGLEFLPVENQKSYWQVDSALTFYGPDRKYHVGAFVNNLFDETVMSQNFPTPGTNFYSTTLRPPRTFGVRAGVEF